MLLSERNQILFQVGQVLNQCQFLVQSLSSFEVIDDRQQMSQSTIQAAKESKKVAVITQELRKSVPVAQKVLEFVPAAQKVLEFVPSTQKVLETIVTASKDGEIS